MFQKLISQSNFTLMFPYLWQRYLILTPKKKHKKIITGDMDENIHIKNLTLGGYIVIIHKLLHRMSSNFVFKVEIYHWIEIWNQTGAIILK